MAVDVQALIAQADQLKQERTPWENHWQELARYILPRRADFLQNQQAGGKRTEDIFESTAPWACEQLAAALHGLLTSPATPWFTLKVSGSGQRGAFEKAFFDPSNSVDEEAKHWLDHVGEAMLALLNDPETNFQAQLHELYLDIACFGTGVLYVAHENDKWLFATRHLSEICVSESLNGQIDTVFRRFSMTARQAFQMWGPEAGEKVRAALEQGRAEESFDFLHAVFPRQERQEGRREASHMPFASVYIDLSDQRLIAEGGYEDCPYIVARWTKLVGERYGRSPAMTALPDVKMVNQMAKTVLTAAHMAVDPPLQLPDDGYLKSVAIRPGARFYRKGSERIEPILTGARADIGLDMMNQIREQIMRAFYVEWFQLQQGPQMTATEVLARQQERMRLMGPMVGRLQSELLGPLIHRVFGLMSRLGLLPPPPESLCDRAYQVAYVSPVAKAMRANEAQTIQGLLGSVGPMTQMAPAVSDNINFDATLRHLADVAGVPNSILHDEKTVTERRQERRQAALEAEGLAEGL